METLLTFFSIFQMKSISSAMATMGLWVTMTGLASWAEEAMPVTEGSPSPPGDTSPWPRNNRCREYKNRNIGAENRAKNWIKLLMLGRLDLLRTMKIKLKMLGWEWEYRNFDDQSIFLVLLVDGFGCCPHQQAGARPGSIVFNFTCDITPHFLGVPQLTRLQQA